MQGLYSIGLLIVSNVFMTLAWYGHLKLQEMKVINNWPLYGVILLSWGIALFEYCCQVPANRLGFRENGGPFSLMQLKVIQEVITLIIFTLFSVVVFKGDHSVFTTASLIQIFGRVGRSFKDPDGKGVCLCQALNKSIKDCVSQISKMNDTVYAVTNR